MHHSLALEQHVGLSEQGHLWSQAPLAVCQVADVTPQLLLALPARLQLAPQLPQLLLKPDVHNKRGFLFFGFDFNIQLTLSELFVTYLLICSAW